MSANNILDPKFRYVPAAATDIRKTFDRARRAIRAQQDAERAAASGALKNVAPLNRERA